MSDVFHQLLMEDVGRTQVPKKTWDEVKQRGLNAAKPATGRRKWPIYGSSAACLAAAVVITSGFVSPSMAAVLQKVPLVGALYAFDNPKLNAYATSDNPSVTDKGITVSIPKVYYDGTQLYILYAIRVPEGYQPVDGSQINLGTPGIQIDGQLLQGDAQWGDAVKGSRTYEGNLSMNLRSGSFPTQGTLTIPIRQVGNVTGNWTLSLPVSTKLIQTQTKSVPVGNATASYDGISLTVKHIDKGPVYTAVSMEMRQPIQSNGQGKHDMSVRTFNFLTRTSDNKYLQSDIAKLSPIEKTGNTEVWDFTVQYPTPSTPVTSVTIIPDWLQPVPGPSSVKIPLTGQFPIKLKLGGYGTTDINRIQFNSDSTQVTTTLETDGLEHPLFWFQSNDGKVYKLTREHGNTYTFPAIPHGQNLFVCAQQDSDIAGIMKDVPQLAITVPLP